MALELAGEMQTHLETEERAVLVAVGVPVFRLALPEAQVVSVEGVVLVLIVPQVVRVASVEGVVAHMALLVLVGPQQY